MKIGVLTYYHDLNCGTTLQAYATLLAVKSVFPNDHVEIVPFRNFNRRYLPYKSQATIASICRDFVRIFKYRSFLKTQLQIKEDFLTNDPQIGVEYIKSLHYDRIYVGADTILELDTLPKGGDGLTAFWLPKDIDPEVYLLAASSKNVSYATLSKKQKQQMRERISNYAGVFVRDTATYDLFAEFVNRDNIQMICDPTITLPIDYTYAESYIKKKRFDFTNVICFHPIKGERWCEEVANKLRNEGYKIACFRPVKWADYVLNDMGPLEQLGIYKYFTCFVTHRFHDTVFCMKNSTPVVLYPYKDEFYSQGGHSKYSAICDLFDIRELSYVERKSEITPDLMFKKIKRVIECFNAYIPAIEKKRDELACDYINKLKSTII